MCIVACRAFNLFADEHCVLMQHSLRIAGNHADWVSADHQTHQVWVMLFTASAQLQPLVDQGSKRSNCFTHMLATFFAKAVLA